MLSVCDWPANAGCTAQTTTTTVAEEQPEQTESTIEYERYRRPIHHPQRQTEQYQYNSDSSTRNGRFYRPGEYRTQESSVGQTQNNYGYQQASNNYPVTEYPTTETYYSQPNNRFGEYRSPSENYPVTENPRVQQNNPRQNPFAKYHSPNRSYRKPQSYTTTTGYPELNQPQFTTVYSSGNDRQMNSRVPGEGLNFNQNPNTESTPTQSSYARWNPSRYQQRKDQQEASEIPATEATKPNKLYPFEYQEPNRQKPSEGYATEPTKNYYYVDPNKFEYQELNRGYQQSNEPEFTTTDPPRRSHYGDYSNSERKNRMTNNDFSQRANLKTDSPGSEEPRKFARIVDQDKNLNSSYVVYEDEVSDDHQDDVEQIEDSSQLSPCDPNDDQKICTLSNYEWLQIADTEIDSDKLLKKIHFDEVERRNFSKISDECHQICSEIRLQSVHCVAYTYSFKHNDCLLYYEVELDADFPNTLLQNYSKGERGKGLRARKDYNSRITIPKWNLMVGQWLISENLIPSEMGLDEQHIRNVRNVKNESNHQMDYVSFREKNFFDCFNLCSGEFNCGHFLYDAIDRHCLVIYQNESSAGEEKNVRKRKDSSEEEEDDTSHKKQKDSSEEVEENLIEKISSKKRKIRNKDRGKNRSVQSILRGAHHLRRGWFAGYDLNDASVRDSIQSFQSEKLNQLWNFYTEQSPVLLQLIEQLVLQQEDEIGLKRSRYLQPIEIHVSVANIEECRWKCLQTWTGDQARTCKFVAIRKNLLLNDTVGFAFEMLILNFKLSRLSTVCCLMRVQSV